MTEIMLLMGVLIGVLTLNIRMWYVHKRKQNDYTRRIEALAKENKYIDAYTGQIREYPIGEYTKNGESHYLYASEHHLKEVRDLMNRGYTISLQEGDDNETKQMKTEGLLKKETPIGIFEDNGRLYYVYPETLERVKKAGHEVAPIPQMSVQPVVAKGNHVS